MNYIYNIRVNLKDELINFYEWTNTDKITKLNKVKIYVINRLKGNYNCKKSKGRHKRNECCS